MGDEPSSGGPALNSRPPAPQSPSRGRTLLETIAARDAAEVSQLREALAAETERTDEADTFAASFADRKYEYTGTLGASVKDLKRSLAAAHEDLEAAREAQTPTLAKLTVTYRSVRDSLDCMLNRADQLATDLREEQAARRRDRALGSLRRFADLVLFHVRLRPAAR